jgi:hypothetical protein
MSRRRFNQYVRIKQISKQTFSAKQSLVQINRHSASTKQYLLDPTMTIRIPVDEPEEAVLQMLPPLKKFTTIIKNLHHPQLRRLIFYSNDSDFNHHEVLESIRASLSYFTNLISLKIDIPHFFDVTRLEDLGLPNFTILPVEIPDSLTNEAVRRLLPSLQRFEKIRIDMNPGHLEILKECVNLRRLSVNQCDVYSDAQIEETIALIIGHIFPLTD